MKKNNKGFTLVELIIVMAIIAILAAVIAPNLMQYINKSKRTKDIATAETIATAVSAAVADKEKFAIIKQGTAGANTVTIDATTKVVTGGVTISAALKDTDVEKYVGSDKAQAKAIADSINSVLDLNTKVPQTVYKTNFVFGFDDNGKVIVAAADDSGAVYQMLPERAGKWGQ